MRRHGFAVILGAVVLGLAITGYSQERHRLYTKTDPTATGGIKGEIMTPSKAIVEILAMPPDEPRFVYEGKITGPDNRGFLFENLPMARYNLFVIYNDDFYEGLELSRVKDTLTPADRKKIEYIINESDPFFPDKVFHRMAGTTGRGNFSRCLVTMYRDRGPMRRTFKLIWLKDVGPGWQVVQKRDLYPINAPKNGMNPKHYYSDTLSAIRVTDEIKDLGKISLSTLKKDRPDEANKDRPNVAKKDRPQEAEEGE